MLNFAKGCTIGFHLHWPFNKYRRIGSYGRPRSHLANKNYFLSFPSNSVPIIYSISVYPGLAAAKSLQSCPTLRDPIVGSPPGSPVPGILQARTLEWVAISLSIAWKWKVKSLSRVRLLATPWTAAQQAPPSMGFSTQEYWSGVPSPSPYPGLTSSLLWKILMPCLQ